VKAQLDEADESLAGAPATIDLLLGRFAAG